jgi:hypothetical protein
MNCLFLEIQVFKVINDHYYLSNQKRVIRFWYGNIMVEPVGLIVFSDLNAIGLQQERDVADTVNRTIVFSSSIFFVFSLWSP